MKFIVYLQEVLVNGIFLPTIELMSDPDYWNQNMAWWVSNTVTIRFDQYYHNKHLQFSK